MNKPENPITLRTPHGQRREGVTGNDRLKKSIELINDIFGQAWNESLDLFITCSKIDQEKNELFHLVLDQSFTDLLEIVLKHGSNVCLLLWSTDHADLMSDEILALQNRIANAAGQLEVRLSDCDDKRFGHLIIATNPKMDRCILRLEESDQNNISRRDFEGWASVFFDNELAKKSSAQVLFQFAYFFGESALFPSNLDVEARIIKFKQQNSPPKNIRRLEL